jgi:hypothetical protein
VDLVMRIFICRTTDGTVYKLTDKELLNVKPTIDKNGNAILIINYYDFEYCLRQTIYCDRIDVIGEEETNYEII